MEKIKQFFKNKAIGYYVALGVALLTLIFAIIFITTFKNPALSDGSPVMGNKSVGLAPETIAVFLIAGLIAEVVVLVLPQYRFLQVVVVLLLGLALYKDIIIIPDFFAGIANGVMYNGGNLELNIFYLVMLLIIVIASVVAIFLDFLKSDEERKNSFIPKGIPQIVKAGAGGAVIVAALVVSLVISSSLDKASGGGKVKVSPITEAMRRAADECEYDFDPTSVVIKEQENWDYNNAEMKGLAYSATREGHNLVYVFEGEYSEGYQGQYNTYLTGMYLWDDGMMVGRSNSDTFRGYWYNSSLTAPEDNPETLDVDESVDCLNMVSDDEFTKSDGGASFTDKFFKSIITQPPMGGTNDFYECQAYVYMYPGWGKGRSVVVSGYKYYPDVATFIDTNDTATMKVGEKFVVNSTWFLDKVIKNLKYTPVIPTSEVTWEIPEGMIDDSKRLLEPGQYEITAKWKDYEATATLRVTK